MNEKCLIAPYLASSPVNLFKPENKSHFKLKKDRKSTQVNGFLKKWGYTSYSVK